MKIDKIDELLAMLSNDKKESISIFFSYCLNFSDVFEDKIIDIIQKAYLQKIRCTKINKQFCIENGLYNIDYSQILSSIAEKLTKKKKEDVLIDISEKDLKSFLENNDIFFSKIYDCINDWYRMVISEMNAIENADIDDVDELKEMNDKIGDVHTTSKKFSIDEPIRDYPFIYYSGDWFNWDNEFACNSHDSIMSILTDGKARIRSNNLRDLENVEGIDATQPAIFGDHIDDLGFIEAYENLSLDEASNIMKQRFEKVYMYNQEENFCKRVASNKYFNETSKEVLKDF